MRVPFRAFIAVDFPSLEGVASFLHELKETGAPLKLVRPANVHLTLKFLGDTQETLIPKIVDEMTHAVEGIPPFTIRLKGTGAFPGLRRINVVWVGVEGGEPLVEIARRLESSLEPLGFPRESRDLSLHVTVARARIGKGLDPVRTLLGARAGVALDEVPVDRIRLKKSVLTPSGPEYYTVEEAPLPTRKETTE